MYERHQKTWINWTSSKFKTFISHNIIKKRQLTHWEGKKHLQTMYLMRVAGRLYKGLLFNDKMTANPIFKNE